MAPAANAAIGRDPAVARGEPAGEPRRARLRIREAQAFEEPRPRAGRRGQGEHAVLFEVPIAILDGERRAEPSSTLTSSPSVLHPAACRPVDTVGQLSCQSGSMTPELGRKKPVSPRTSGRRPLPSRYGMATCREASQPYHRRSRAFADRRPARCRRSRRDVGASGVVPGPEVGQGDDEAGQDEARGRRPALDDPLSPVVAVADQDGHEARRGSTIQYSARP